ncbi:MAG: sugar phosphate isomerase/epimerase family protein [Planctomycetaceae bacterium]
MQPAISRRDVLTAAGAAAVGLAGKTVVADRVPKTTDGVAAKTRFRFCLNTSTIRGQKKPLEQEVDIAAKAGYSGIEPWIREIRDYVRRGGKLKDLKKRIADAGLTVESAIGFARWIIDDDRQRTKSLEDARRDMDLLQQIGGRRIAAPPTGATRQSNLDLLKAAERYGELLKIGSKIGVTPQLEVWGFSRSISRLGEAMHVAVESGRPEACLLPDVYHLYKGGSHFAGLELIHGNAIHVFHVNDYPADPPRAKINDADRVYPGDGVAPLAQVVRTLVRTGFQGALSLELFNRDYWKQDATAVAKTGLAKMKAVVEKYA